MIGTISINVGYFYLFELLRDSVTLLQLCVDSRFNLREMMKIVRDDPYGFIKMLLFCRCFITIFQLQTACIWNRTVVDECVTEKNKSDWPLSTHLLPVFVFNFHLFNCAVYIMHVTHLFISFNYHLYILSFIFSYNYDLILLKCCHMHWLIFIHLCDFIRCTWF